MARKQQKVKAPEAAPSIAYPEANKPAPVVAMGPASYGTLCRCEGQVLQPLNTYFGGLYFRVGRGGTHYTAQEVKDAPDATWNQPGGYPRPWDKSGALLADCNIAGTAPNRLHVVTLSYNYPIYAQELELATADFYGKSVTSCPSTATARGVAVPMMADATSPLLPLIPPPGAPRAPSETDGDWLLYSQLSPSELFFGNLLMRHGQPLRARLLAVAAANVDWSWKIPISESMLVRQSVRRPVGDLKFNPPPEAWRFPDAVRNCIAISQYKLDEIGVPTYPAPPEQVVTSTCRSAPDFIEIFENHIILAQVNHFLHMQWSVRGTFDLWVKVLD